MLHWRCACKRRIVKLSPQNLFLLKFNIYENLMILFIFLFFISANWLFFVKVQIDFDVKDETIDTPVWRALKKKIYFFNELLFHCFIFIWLYFSHYYNKKMACIGAPHSTSIIKGDLTTWPACRRRHLASVTTLRLAMTCMLI
jgi:hypothetical protein